MCLPKQKTVIILWTILLFVWFNVNAQTQFPPTKNTSTCHFDSSKLARLLEKDSLYQATRLVNEAIRYAKKNNLKTTEAKAYIALGDILAKMSNYKKSENYFSKASKIFDSLANRKGQDLALSRLLYCYAEDYNDRKFDSIFPKAQALSKSLNSETYFFNLDNLMKKSYYNFNHDMLLETSNLGLSVIDSVDFENLNYSKDLHLPIKNIKEKFYQSYKYYNALARIKLEDTKASNYNLLLSIKDKDLKVLAKPVINSYRKLATLNYYKYLYYTKPTKNLDSANKYLLKSDTYKYKALHTIDKENTRNGELVYNIINAEQKLNLTEELQKKDAKASQTFLISTIILSLLFVITLISFFFYFKAKKNIDKINKALKSSNSKLKATDKDRAEFFSILSHELRTPIYGIGGLATLIDQENDEAKRQSYLDSLISSSNYLSILIDNVLQANRLKFEKKNLRLKPGKINQIVKHVVSTIAVAAENKDLELKVHIDESDENEHILIDKVAFSQILINHAYIAIRYTKKGHISISVFEKKRSNTDVTLRFEVEDTGIGIKDEHRHLVFSAFENKAFLHKNSSGSGLGLFIVKTLLKSHNSDIDFISTPHKGTCFFFEITFEFANMLQLQNTTSEASNRDMHILIVDDNKINLLITKKNIEKIAGYSCQTVSTGKEAISIVKDKDFDLILMDINMPDMDGYEVTKHIRMFNKSIPILALTALNSSEISLKAEAIGIDQIITKPYIFEDFKTIITSYEGYRRDTYHNDIDAEAI